jgi:heme exporter protein A
MSFADIAAFRAEGLACRRGDRLIFQGLGFSLAPSGALLLLGRNGSGKSSLLRLLAGLLKPAAGTLFWGDETVGAEREAHAGRLHYLGHQDAVKPVLTVEENLLFWARLHDPATPPDRIAAALAAFNLTPLAQTPGKLLSAGQQRRLALARLLAAPAPLWLLDEPSVGLDQESLARLETILAEHRAAGGMVALSTHADIALPGAEILQLGDFAPSAEQVMGIWI